MATLTTQVVPHTGLAVSLAAAAGGGDKGIAGAGVNLVVRNADAAPHTVTLAIPAVTKIDGDLTISNRPVVVAAGAFELIPLIDLYTNPVDGLTSWTYDAVTSMTVAVVRS